MSTDRGRPRRLAWIALTLVAGLLVTACSDDEGDAVTDKPLATTAPGDSALLCDLVPRSSVATALGRAAGDLETTGSLTHDSATDHVNGRCLVRSATRSEMALTVTVLWPSTEQQQAVRSKVTEGGADYTFPSDFAEGYADGSRSSAVAEVIWGDYVVTVVDNEPADGRDPLKDSVALVHQVIDAIDLAKTPADGASSAG
jgi:hypothetical protein